jgi:plastocyanin
MNRRVLARSAPAAAAAVLVGLSGVPCFADPRSDAVTCSPNGTALSIVAFDEKFDKKCLAAPAGEAFTIDFKNLDRGIPHNVAIYSDQTAQKQLFKGDLIAGPGFGKYSVPGLPSGRWFFRCDPHPGMNGTFIVAKQ